MELALALTLAVALADFAWLLLSRPGDKQAPGPAAGRSALVQPAVARAGNAGGENLSPALLRLFGQAEGIAETELDLTLKGILAQRGGARKVALIAQGGGKEQVYRLGERVAGAEITHIEARRVILLYNSRREALALETAVPRRGNSFEQRQARGGITTLDAHARVVSRDLFKQQLQRLPEVLDQARAAPYWDHNGLEAGFRVVDIESDSVFDRLGLMQEDVIVSVNGESVRNNQEALAAYQSFKSAEALQLGLLRDGQEVTIDFSIR
ncbi:MAG: PDZ domain-containing protein [Gammaproteobacteria bacterium]|nr:PDZ domain-containing protein [Gammaproteobacteria bacterium]